MRVTKEFPREYKFSLGQKIKDEVVELVVLIYKANSSEDKVKYINTLLERLQVVGLLLRLCHDLKIMPSKNYASIVEMVESLGRQAQGWKKSNSKSKPNR
jgi:hypothetical protein